MAGLHREYDEGKYNERLLFAHYIVCGLSFYSSLCRSNLCVERPTSYFVLIVTISNLNYSVAHSIVPDDKAFYYIDKL